MALRLPHRLLQPTSRPSQTGQLESAGFSGVAVGSEGFSTLAEEAAAGAAEEAAGAAVGSAAAGLPKKRQL